MYCVFEKKRVLLWFLRDACVCLTLIKQMLCIKLRFQIYLFLYTPEFFSNEVSFRQLHMNPYLLNNFICFYIWF